MTHLTWSDELGKRVRTGDWADQAISTVTKVNEAIREGRSEVAAQLIDYFMEEAKVVQFVYDTWTPGFLEWLELAGYGEAELAAAVEDLRVELAMLDGTPFDGDALWLELGAQAGRLTHAVRAELIETDQALAEFEAIRVAWRRLHDRWADFLSGIMKLCADRFGEAALEDAYRHALEPYIQERYMVYDLREKDYADTVFRNVYTSFEAMRSHLVGPDRMGDIECTEHEDRWVFQFDPCGSGGRQVRGIDVEESPPDPQRAVRFGVTSEAYDWSWNSKGVCYYCAHCCFTLEMLPAERWGHPVRRVDPPLFPDDTTGENPKPCTWTVYKTLDAIPTDTYTRIGRTKPSSS